MSVPPQELIHARENGSRWYFTGKPCTRGHVAKRFTSSRGCVECANQRERERRVAEPEFGDKLRAKNRKYCAERRAVDPDFVEKIRQRGTDWARANKHRVKAYQAARPEMMRELTARRRATKRAAAPSWLTSEHTGQIRSLFKEAARLRRATGEAHHVDHIFPLQGENSCGLHVPWNLRVLTAFENISKKNRWPEEHKELAW